MQGVEGQWNGSLSVNGQEVSLHQKSLASLYVINSIHQNLPTLKLGFKDDTAMSVAGLGIGDGTQMNLVLGDGTQNEMGATFSVAGDLRIMGSHSAELVELTGILDHLPWMRQIVSGVVQGPSSAAIAKVASQAGLIPDVHSTSDTQIWLPNNKPLASFARHVQERGWASATSCMMLAVMDSSKCRYFDIDRVGSGSSSKLFGQDGHPVLKYQIDSKADLYNNSTGYGATSTNVTPEGIFKELGKIDVRMLGNKLSAGARSISALGALGGRIIPRALDIGNVHKMWNEAQHQNQRIRSLYSHDVHILSDKLSGVELLDLVDLNLLMHGNGQPLTTQNGSYIVTAYTRVLAANRYFEKITLTSQGTN